MRVLLLPLLLLIQIGCGSQNDTRVLAFGTRGLIEGRFGLPRGIDVEGENVYVVDRTGRVQAFSMTGEFQHQWYLDKYDNGTPTGLTVDDQGNVWIADTHNSKIHCYSPAGEKISTWGDYGEEAGHLIYPTDITFGDDGNLYISEYGIHDRIQIFTPDGEYIRHWGDFGEDEHSFSRPMAIAKGTDGNLYVADAGNHRIKVYTQAGELLRYFGTRGSEPGQFDFPYDLDFDADGYLYVCDYSNHRIQKLTTEGEWLQTWGGLGDEPGQLFNPWGVAVAHDWLFVADARNNRVQAYPVDGLRPIPGGIDSSMAP